MVLLTMAWLSGVNKGTHSHSLHGFRHDNSPPPATLRILAFDTAKTMSRLLSLYKSLSDDEFSKLRRDAMKSPGVAFLNSKDEGYLLSLACAEKLQDLNRVASTVSRLGHKCSDSDLNRFELVYADMHVGVLDIGKVEFSSRNAEKIIEKMEKYVAATSNLHSAMEFLNEMELSERKMQQWKKNLYAKQPNKANFDYFNEKMAFHKKQVRHYRETSLWSQTFDKSVSLMARLVGIVYARICVLFGPFVPSLPRITKSARPASIQKQLHTMRIHPETDYCLLADRDKYLKPTSKSGPIPKSSKKSGHPRFYSGQLSAEDFGVGSRIRGIEKRGSGGGGESKRGVLSAPPSTVGGSGLALRYANVIIIAETYLNGLTKITEDARGYLYEMLPASLKAMVSGKLKKQYCKEKEEGSDGKALAEGWREALEEMMEWLAPMAHDTVRWQTERNLEKQKFDAQPSVLLLQTLYFSDVEKTEAAIVEVLVGLSYIFRYENRVCGRRRGGDRCR